MDTSTTIIIVASVLFLITSIINGIWKRSSKNLIDYIATPNKFPTFPLVVSMIGTIIGGGIVIGMTSMGAKGGVIGIVLALWYAIAFLLLSFLIPRIRKLTNDTKIFSLIDLIDEKIKQPFSIFHHTIRISSLISLIFFTSYFFILAAQFVAISSVITALFPTSSIITIVLIVVSILCVINIILYSAFWGLEKDIRTDLFQCALILITTIALLIIPFQNGNPFPAILSLPDTYFNGTGYGIAFLIVALLAPLPSFIVRYDMWQRIIAAKNTKTAQKMLKFLAGGIVLFFAIFTFLGMYIQSQYHLSSSEMDNALFMLLSSHSYFYAIIFVCILAAVLSSADTMLNVASLSFSKFCFKKDWKKISATTPETTQEHISLKRKMIIVTIGIGIISVVVGYLLQDIVSLLIGAVSALTVLFPVIFNILLWKSVNPKAAFWSIAIGYMVFLIVSFVLKMPDESFIPAFIVACLIFYPLNHKLTTTSISHQNDHTCKLLLMRHGQSIYNKKMSKREISGFDYRDDTNELSEKGREQAKDNVEKIAEAVKHTDTIFYISLLSRAVQTIEPYFETTFWRKLTEHPVYLATKKRFNEAMKNNTFHRQDFTNIEVEKNIYLDARVMEWHIDSGKIDYIPMVNECKGNRQEIEERAENFIQEIAYIYAGKQIIVSTHRFFILWCKRHFDGIIYQLNLDPNKTEVKIKNGELYPFYLT